jgi:TadE-like protein
MYRQKKRKKGQVVVEVMLVLPVFMLIVFACMEIGGVAFQTLIAHHIAYEAARIASLLDGSTEKLDQLRSKVPDGVVITASTEQTLEDPQSEGHYNEDVVVKVEYPGKLVFPITSYFFSNPKGSGEIQIVARVRMPVEKKLFK